MMGFEFPDVRERLASLGEALEILRSLWTEEHTTYEGAYYHLKDAVASPKPIQKPYPPIMLGGNGKGVMRLAARHADIVNIAQDLGRAGTVDPRHTAAFTADVWRARVAFLRAECEQAGRPVPRLYTTAFVINVTDDAAGTRAVAENFAGMFGVGPDAVLRMPSVLIGTPEELIAELRRREVEDGLHELTVGIPSMRIVRRLGTDVLPYLR
jgi:alkanesulfonate monooxygenase SsuD/methylene tetrahydromethanopterin reductase-like flavin-dependent oxidoreductase (luciferase family)